MTREVGEREVRGRECLRKMGWLTENLSDVITMRSGTCPLNVATWRSLGTTAKAVLVPLTEVGAKL